MIITLPKYGPLQFSKNPDYKEAVEIDQNYNDWSVHKTVESIMIDFTFYERHFYNEEIN